MPISTPAKISIPLDIPQVATGQRTFTITVESRRETPPSARHEITCNYRHGQVVPACTIYLSWGRDAYAPDGQPFYTQPHALFATRADDTAPTPSRHV